MNGINKKIELERLEEKKTRANKKILKKIYVKYESWIKNPTKCNNGI